MHEVALRRVYIHDDVQRSILYRSILRTRNGSKSLRIPLTVYARLVSWRSNSEMVPLPCRSWFYFVPRVCWTSANTNWSRIDIVLRRTHTLYPVERYVLLFFHTFHTLVQWRAQDTSIAKPIGLLFANRSTLAKILLLFMIQEAREVDNPLVCMVQFLVQFPLLERQ